MKSRLIVLLFIFSIAGILILLYVGTQNQTVKYDQIPSIKINDKIYQSTGRFLKEKPISYEVIGKVESEVDGKMLPQKNLQSNFGMVTAEIIRTNQTYYIKTSDGWMEFE